LEKATLSSATAGANRVNDPAAFIPLMIKGGQKLRRLWPLRRFALEGIPILMPVAPRKIRPRSFDSARQHSAVKLIFRSPSLRMTEFERDAFANIDGDGI
jgi:hypothetical protein